MRVLGIDWGEKRMGFAVSDPLGIVAMPLDVVEVSGSKQSVEAVRRICAETEAEQLVVGLPVNMDGSHGEMAKRIETFVAALKEELKIGVSTWDERMSSLSADRVLDEAGMDQKKRRGVRDKLAAQFILQGYLESQSIPQQDEEDR